MKVTDKRNEKDLTFKDIEAGGVFRKGSYTYIKFDVELELENGEFRNCVCLEDGETEGMADLSSVTLCEAELILK